MRKDLAAGWPASRIVQVLEALSVVAHSSGHTGMCSAEVGLTSVAVHGLDASALATAAVPPMAMNTAPL